MKLKTGWAFVLMLILVVGSVLFGAYRGWSEERARVNETYKGLESMLQTRVESAYNVLAVAKRHVTPEDEAYRRVFQDLSLLEGGSPGVQDSLRQKAQGNEALTRDAAELLEKLSQLDSVKNDQRDRMYVESYLPQMLTESEAKTAGAAYNQAAAEFNGRMKGTFSGWLARVMGIGLAEEFIAE